MGLRVLAGVGLVALVASNLACTVDQNGLTWTQGRGGSGGGETGTDGGDDGALGGETPPDVREDVGEDTGGGTPDAAMDVAIDRGVDVGMDRPPADVGQDVGPDLAPDVPPDVPVDRPPDVPADVPVDRGPDGQPVDTGVDMRICGSTQHVCNNVCVDNNSLATCGSSCTACPVPPNGMATCNGTSCGITCNTNFVPSGTTCVRSCTPTCEAGAMTVTAPGGRFTDTTSGASTSTGSCGGDAAPETVFRLNVTVTSDLFATTHGTAFDTVLYLRSSCCGADIVCNNDADGRRTSVLTRTALAPGNYDLIVDGATAADAGDFTIDIFLSPIAALAGDTCARPLRLGSAAVTGTTCGFQDNAMPTPLGGTECQAPSVRNGEDVIYYFVLDKPTHVGVDTCTGTCYDSVLYLRDVCTQPMTEVACKDDSCFATPGCPGETVGQQSSIGADLAAGVHYVVVDTFSGTPVQACGSYVLTPQGIPP